MAGGRHVQQGGTSDLRELSRPRANLKELAQDADVSYSLVLKVAAGRRKPNQAIRDAVERLYRVPASIVFGDDVARPRKRRPR